MIDNDFIERQYYVRFGRTTFIKKCSIYELVYKPKNDVTNLQSHTNLLASNLKQRFFHVCATPAKEFDNITCDKYRLNQVNT